MAKMIPFLLIFAALSQFAIASNSSLYIPSGGMTISNIPNSEDSNAISLYDVANLFLIMEATDPYSQKPNYSVKGIKIIPLIVILATPFLIWRWRKFKKNVQDYYKTDS